MPQEQDKKNYASAPHFWQNKGLKWIIGLILSFSMPLGIFFLYPLFWRAHHLYILLDALAIPILFVYRLRQPKFWRENRWIIMPAAFVLLVWVNSTWAQSFLLVENLQSLQIYPPSGQTSPLHATYPQRILYETGEIPSLSLWWDCSLKFPCTNMIVTLTSDNDKLQFAIQSDVPVWQTTLTVTLFADGSEKTILLRRPGFAESQRAKLTVGIGATTNEIGTIILEGAQESRTRNFYMGLFQTSNVVITIIVAIFAGLKQLDEQKRNKRKNDVDGMIKKIAEFKYESGKLKTMVAEVLPELDDWETWEKDQQDKFINAYRELIDDKKMEIHWWQDVLQSQTEFIKQAITIWEKTLPGKSQPGIFVTIEQQSPAYQQELSAAYFPPEKYPLAEQFKQQAVAQLPTSNYLESWGVPAWEMRFAPFGDGETPFLYWQEGDFDDFPLLKEINFPFIENKLKHQTFFFQIDWDLRAAFYQYCHAFWNRNKPALLNFARHTFFVPVLPDEVPPWRDSLICEDYLLHGLGSAWLRTLAHNPYLIEENTLLEQEMVANLLIGRYRTPYAVKNILLSHAEQSRIPLSPTPGFLQLLDKVKPEKTLGADTISGLLALRPCDTDQTMYLCADVSPSGIRNASQAIYLHSISLKMETTLNLAKVYLLRFLSKGHGDNNETTLKMGDEDLLRLLDKHIVVSNSGAIQAFDGLFYPPPSREMLMSFISRANGSPGTIIQMAHNLLERQIQQSPEATEIAPEALLK